MRQEHDDIKRIAPVAVPPKLPTEHPPSPLSSGYPSVLEHQASSHPSEVPLPLKQRTRTHKILSLIWKVAIFAIVFPVIQVVLLRFIDPPFTTMMLYQSIGNLFSGKPVTWTHTSLNRSEVSPSLYKAILAGEDQRFYLHHGFDMTEIENAQKAHARHPNRPMRGASTISQQTAKNLFLPPWHSFVRKGVEAYYTLLMEWIWPKDRILEVYGNVAEFAPNVYGAEAGAEFHFKRHAKDLTQQQASQMAAVLPNPERWSASHPSPYIQRRSQRILRQMHGIPTEEEEESDEPD